LLETHWGGERCNTPDNCSSGISGRFPVHFQVNLSRFAEDFQGNSGNSQDMRKWIWKTTVFSEKLLYDICGVTLSVYPHRASLKNMPGHGGIRTYDLWNTSLNRAVGPLVNLSQGNWQGVDTPPPKSIY
jgi:hypothetical protein